MKIKTEKYVIYVEGGQIYKGNTYFRPLTESQIDYISANRWNTKSLKSKLEKLIENDFKDMEHHENIPLKEAMKRSGFNQENESSCREHRYYLLDNLEDKYIFYCSKCLDIKITIKDE